MNDRCGCVRAHGYDLTGKMTGGGLHSVAWASAIALDSTSVIALGPGSFRGGSSAPAQQLLI